MFNQKPKNGIAFLEKNGIIAPDPEDPGTDEEKRVKAIAKFLRNSSRLDKKLLGEFISRPDQIELLKAFIGLFDFEGVCLMTHISPDLALMIRNRSPMLCGRCWRPSDCPEKRLRSLGSQRRLRNTSSPSGPVRRRDPSSK